MLLLGLHTLAAEETPPPVKAESNAQASPEPAIIKGTEAEPSSDAVPTQTRTAVQEQTAEPEKAPEEKGAAEHQVQGEPTAPTPDYGNLEKHDTPASATGDHAVETQSAAEKHAAPTGSETTSPSAPGTAHDVPAEKAAPDAHAVDKAHASPGKTQQGAATADAHGADKAHGENKEVPAEIMSMQASELFKYSDKAFEDGRYDMALIGYRQLLSYKMPKAQIRTALLSFGRTLRKQGELTKAVAVYERLIKDFPAEQDTPEIYLELGRCQRALGAYKTAISRFYSVINSTIKLTEDGAAKYRQLAKTAQFEIAETYFIAGDYKEAMRFYSRLRLLDLNPVDRARAHFKAAYAQELAGDHLGAITQLRSFIELNPDDENVPEARYLIAMGLRGLGRSQDSLYEALELLRTERTRTAQDPKRWAYWQRKTGNQIANEFYNQGDTNSALMIYLSLVELSSEPAWRAPMLYQIALCQERQGRKDKAIENYKSILDIAAAQKGDDPRKTDFAELARMATWRLSQIEWVHNAEQRLNTLLPNVDSEGSQPPSAPQAQK